MLLRPQRFGASVRRSRNRGGVRGTGRLAALTCVLCLSLFAVACNEAVEQNGALTIGGDAQRGVALIKRFGCGTCHLIPGIQGADGLVAPPLIMVGRRVFLAGILRNTPENMMAWIQDPQRFVPGNAMPRMGVTRQEARDITSYLYTLR